MQLGMIDMCQSNVFAFINVVCAHLMMLCVLSDLTKLNPYFDLTRVLSNTVKCIL